MNFIMSKNKYAKLLEIAEMIKENKGMITVPQYECCVSKLFTLIPELEQINKSIRLLV